MRLRLYHARAWECVPAESDAITILHLTPLILKSVVVHLRQLPDLIHMARTAGLTTVSISALKQQSL